MSDTPEYRQFKFEAPEWGWDALPSDAQVILSIDEMPMMWLTPEWAHKEATITLPAGEHTFALTGIVVDQILDNLDAAVLVLRGFVNREEFQVAGTLVEMMARQAQARGVSDDAAQLPLILALSGEQTLETLDEERMRSAGWVRAEPT